MDAKTLKAYQGPDRVVTLKDLSEHLKKVLPDRAFYKTGFPTLDEWLGGFREQEWILISGPPKHGKTSLMQSIAVNYERLGVKTMFFSFDMPEADLIERFERMTITDIDVMPRIYSPLTIPKRALGWVEERIIEAKEKYGVKAVFLDNIMKVFDSTVIKPKAPGTRRIEADEVGIFGSDVKDLARNHNIILFSTHHLVKLTEEMRKRELDARDMRGSALLAAEADGTLMVWRREQQDKKTREWNYLPETVLKLCEFRRAGVYMGEKVFLRYQDELLSENLSENIKSLTA